MYKSLFLAKSFEISYNASMIRIQKLILGDEEEISKFYKEFSQKILRYLKMYLPQEQAEEIANDVFIDAIDSLTTLKKNTNLNAWLFSIAHNKMVDYYRKKKFKTFLFSQFAFFEIIASEIHEPEFQMEKDKVRSRIEATLHKLSKRYREILQLRYEEQMPVKQIALLYGLSPKATESLIFRARRHFITIYERT
jgi:RNA polymerase sigma-70 factor (ECF subfamily)